MKAFVVMTNYYGYEGWKISGDTDDFEEAVAMREQSLSMGNSEVVIFRPVILEIKEKQREEEHEK